MVCDVLFKFVADVRSHLSNVEVNICNPSLPCMRPVMNKEMKESCEEKQESASLILSKGASEVQVPLETLEPTVLHTDEIKAGDITASVQHIDWNFFPVQGRRATIACTVDDNGSTLFEKRTLAIFSSNNMLAVVRC